MGNYYYRVAHHITGQGLWYDSHGKFTGLIHKQFRFCKNSKLRMPYNRDVVGWLSATSTIEELFQWFPKNDIRRLENDGYFITAYEANDVRKHENHLLIKQDTSNPVKRYSIHSFIESDMSMYAFIA